MQQIIIGIGPDRCGKTNILTTLSQKINVPYFKASTEHLNFLERKDKFINELRYADPRMIDFLTQTQHSVIMDRGYPCEWVYSHYLKRETDLTSLTLIDEYYARLNTKLLICTRRNFINIKDDLNPEMDLIEIHRLYLQFMTWTKCKMGLLYVDNENLNEQIEKITNWLSVYQTQQTVIL